VHTIVEYIFLLGAAQGLLLTVFLFNNEENKIANRLLAVSLLAYALDILYALYTHTGYYLTFPAIIGLNGPLPFVYSPCIYLYIVSMSNNEQYFSKRFLIHFSPFAALLLVGMILLPVITTDYKLSLMNPILEKDISITIMRTIIPIYGILYTVMCLIAIRNYHLRLKENYSNIEKLKLNWLFSLLIGISFVWLLELIQIILIGIFNKPEDVAYNYIYIAISILIFNISYKSLKYPKIFSEIKFQDKTREENTLSNKLEDPGIPYKKSGLSELKAKELLQNFYH
jgi:hypothetical protein